MPTTASSSCTQRARKRTRYRWIRFENLSSTTSDDRLRCRRREARSRGRARSRTGGRRAARAPRSAIAAACGSWVTSSIADAVARGRSREQPEHLAAALRVEAAGRLVGEQQLRLGRERARDHDALALAHRQLARRGGAARSPRPSRSSSGVDATVRLAHADAVVEQLQRRVVDRRHARQQVELLPHEAQLAGAGSWRRLARATALDTVAPVDQHLRRCPARAGPRPSAAASSCPIRSGRRARPARRARPSARRRRSRARPRRRSTGSASRRSEAQALRPTARRRGSPRRRRAHPAAGPARADGRHSTSGHRARAASRAAPAPP